MRTPVTILWLGLAVHAAVGAGHYAALGDVANAVSIGTLSLAWGAIFCKRVR